MELQLDHLDAFVTAVDRGTFEAAARELSVTPSAVSLRIKALEERVGRILLLRTKPITTTESGETILRLARAVRLLGQDAALELHAADGLAPAAPATIPVVVNADSLATWILPVFAEVAAHHPVAFDLSREDQDHSVQLLRDGTVMAAVTSSREPVQGCTVQPLGSMRYRPTASPAFAARWLSGGRATEFTAAPVVVFDRKDDLQDAYLRRRGVDPAAPPRHHVPASADFAVAVGLGLGWGMLPDAQAARAVADGTLVVLDETGSVDVPLYWQQWRLHSRLLDVVARAVVSGARRELHGQGTTGAR